jgi:hypothetical protein
VGLALPLVGGIRRSDGISSRLSEDSKIPQVGFGFDSLTSISFVPRFSVLEG